MQIKNLKTIIMMSELQLKLKEEAIKVYQETGFTPNKLLRDK